MKLSVHEVWQWARQHKREVGGDKQENCDCESKKLTVCKVRQWVCQHKHEEGEIIKGQEIWKSPGHMCKSKKHMHVRYDSRSTDIEMTTKEISR